MGPTTPVIEGENRHGQPKTPLGRWRLARAVGRKILAGGLIHQVASPSICVCHPFRTSHPRPCLPRRHGMELHSRWRSDGVSLSGTLSIVLSFRLLFSFFHPHIVVFWIFADLKREKHASTNCLGFILSKECSVSSW